MRNERDREGKTMKPELDKELEIWIYLRKVKLD